MNCYRQGDVVIKEEKLKKGKEKKDGILAQGSSTGNSHRIKGNAKLYFTDIKDVLVLDAKEKVVIVHEEHEDIELPKGTYSISIQNEYDWFNNEIRKVAD